MRLDQYIKQEEKISRQKAQELILSGKVRVNQKTVSKVSYKVDEAKDKIEIEDKDILKYVSRAGLKLDYALAHVSISVIDKTCLDLGQSTGGFSDCLLQAGAKKVVGIDVGHDQLHESLKSNERLVFFEGLNVKDIDSDFLKQNFGASNPDFICSDLSFISTLQQLEHIAKFFGTQTEGLLLIKPQFELGAAALNKQGLVKNTKLYEDLKIQTEKSCQQAGLRMLSYFQSQPEGRDGNKEFILHTSKN